jgi:hypothetical protein
VGAAGPVADPQSNAPTPSAEKPGAGAPCETHNPQEEAWGRGVVRAVLQPRVPPRYEAQKPCQLCAEAPSGSVKLLRSGGAAPALGTDSASVPIAPAAGSSPMRRIPHNQWDGRYWARTSDPQLVELVLSQLS